MGRSRARDCPAFDGKIAHRRHQQDRSRSRNASGDRDPQSGRRNIEAGLVRLPVSAGVGGTAGVGWRFNRFDVELKGLIDRSWRC